MANARCLPCCLRLLCGDAGGEVAMETCVGLGLRALKFDADVVAFDDNLVTGYALRGGWG